MHGNMAPGQRLASWPRAHAFYSPHPTPNTHTLKILTACTVLSAWCQQYPLYNYGIGIFVVLTLQRRNLRLREDRRLS